MKKNLHQVMYAILLLLIPHINFGQAPNLRSTSSFAVFTAAGAFNNLGLSVITGDVGTDVGALTGFSGPPLGVVNGFIYNETSPESAQAAIDVALAYMELAGVNCGSTIGSTLGNDQMLAPGVYCITEASTLNGNLILDAQNVPNALFIFKINGALSTSTFASVSLINGASLCNVYWQVNGAFSLGDNSVFRGTLLINGAINLLEGASLFGKALSTAGAVSLHNNNIATNDPLPSASTIIADGEVNLCAGESVTLSGNVGGTWNTEATTTSITVGTAGDYFVTNASGCGSTISNHIIVTVNSLPIASTILAEGPIGLCADESVVLSGNVGGTWSTGETSFSITVSTAGDYFVTTTSNTCGNAISNHILVTLDQRPVINIANPTQSICFTKTLEINLLNATILLDGNNYGGTWSILEAGSDGQFLPGNGFGVATTFKPGKADGKRGYVTLVLTSDDPDGACAAVNEQIRITVLDVDCGAFPWNGDGINKIKTP